MTCENCIHYELCSHNTYIQAKYCGKDKEVYITIKNNTACRFFKDKSLVVELPCRCKDCTHYKSYGGEWGKCQRIEMDIDLRPWDYCCYAEKIIKAKGD